MELTYRPYEGERDLERAIELLLETRSHTSVERHPTVWRLRQLLNLRLWEPERDARLWEDADGSLQGIAFVYKRSREDLTLGLGWILHPQARGTPLLATMLDWAQERAQEMAREQQKTVSLNLAIYEDELDRRALLEQRGFLPIPDIFNWYMARALDDQLPAPVLPEGFTIRPLSATNNSDIEMYENLYSFPPVKRSYRLALLRDPNYSHQVAVAPNSALVAYCELSVNREEWAMSGQRVGWLDYVGTHPNFQQRGLGKAMVLVGLRQLRLWGVDLALLTTLNSNTPAQKTFLASGFHFNERDLCYTKTFPSS